MPGRRGRHWRRRASRSRSLNDADATDLARNVQRRLDSSVTYRRSSRSRCRLSGEPHRQWKGSHTTRQGEGSIRNAPTPKSECQDKQIDQRCRPQDRHQKQYREHERPKTTTEGTQIETLPPTPDAGRLLQSYLPTGEIGDTPDVLELAVLFVHALGSRPRGECSKSIDHARCGRLVSDG